MFCFVVVFCFAQDWAQGGKGAKDFCSRDHFCVCVCVCAQGLGIFLSSVLFLFFVVVAAGVRVTAGGAKIDLC